VTVGVVVVVVDSPSLLDDLLLVVLLLVLDTLRLLLLLLLLRLVPLVKLVSRLLSDLEWLRICSLICSSLTASNDEDSSICSPSSTSSLTSIVAKGFSSVETGSVLTAISFSLFSSSTTRPDLLASSQLLSLVTGVNAALVVIVAALFWRTVSDRYRDSLLTA